MKFLVAAIVLCCAAPVFAERVTIMQPQVVMVPQQFDVTRGYRVRRGLFGCRLILRPFETWTPVQKQQPPTQSVFQSPLRPRQRYVGDMRYDWKK